MVVEVLQAALTDVYTGFVTWLPNLVLAAIVLAVGYVFGRVLGIVVERIGTKAKLNKFTKGTTLKLDLTRIFGTLTRWLIYFVFIQQAILILSIPALTTIVTKIVDFIPGLIGAIVVIIASYVIAVYVQHRIVGVGEIYADVLSKLLFFLIVYVGIATALPLVNIPSELVNQVLLVIIASVGAGFAIAVGLGLKDIVAEMARDYKNKWQRRRTRRRQ